jgi:hypothetical protein
MKLNGRKFSEPNRLVIPLRFWEIESSSISRSESGQLSKTCILMQNQGSKRGEGKRIQSGGEKESNNDVPEVRCYSTFTWNLYLKQSREMRTHKEHTCERKKNRLSKLSSKLMQMIWFSSQRARMESPRCFKCGINLWNVEDGNQCVEMCNSVIDR